MKARIRPTGKRRWAPLFATLLAILPFPARATPSRTWLEGQTNISPTANPGNAPKIVASADDVATFDGTASSDRDGSVASGTWDFGDGSIAQGSLATHAYARPGAYVAQLTIRDDRGAIDSAPLLVEVGTQPAMTTQDVNVPVTGGYGLHVRVTRPNDAARHPVVMRYSPYCVSFNTSDEALVRSGYVFISAEAPGVCGSGGGFDLFGPLVGQGGYDLIEWAGSASWSDGNVGLVGHSGPAITGLAAARTGPPHLRTVVLGSTFVDAYRDAAYPGGVLSAVAPEYDAVIAAEPRQGMEPGPRAQGWAGWEEVALRHPTDDAAWKARSLASDFAALDIPAYLITSWNDLFARGAFEFFANRANADSRIAVYPGPHWSFDPTGTMGFRAVRDQDVHAGSEERVWLDRWLRGIGGTDARPPLAYFLEEGGGAAAHAFSAGAWNFSSAWPLAGTDWQRWYLHSGGELNTAGPGRTEDDDILTPSPLANAADPQWVDFWSNAGHRPYDAHPFTDVPDRRADDVQTLEWTTDPFAEAATVAGPITLSFGAALVGTDATFHASLSDVWPDGSVHLLSSGKLRASMRAIDGSRTTRNASGDIVRVWHPHDAFDPLDPGEDATYVVEIWPIANTFAPGHRLEVALALSEVPWSVPDASPVGALLHHDAARPMSILLPIIPG